MGFEGVERRKRRWKRSAGTQHRLFRATPEGRRIFFRWGLERTDRARLADRSDGRPFLRPGAG